MTDYERGGESASAIYKEVIRDYVAENAKLRELVDYMKPIAWYAASERERDRMRELGIEVDG